MYGFVEPWLARVFDVDGYEYGTPGGGLAKLVDRAPFERIFRTIYQYHQHCHGIQLETPQIISANVQGTKIILMRWWANENILYSLTDGPIKETDSFVNFMSMENPRFNMDQTIRGIENFISGTRLGESAASELDDILDDLDSINVASPSTTTVNYAEAPSYPTVVRVTDLAAETQEEAEISSEEEDRRIVEEVANVVLPNIDGSISTPGLGGYTGVVGGGLVSDATRMFTNIRRALNLSAEAVGENIHQSFNDIFDDANISPVTAENIDAIEAAAISESLEFEATTNGEDLLNPKSKIDVGEVFIDDLHEKVRSKTSTCKMQLPEHTGYNQKLFLMYDLGTSESIKEEITILARTLQKNVIYTQKYIEAYSPLIKKYYDTKEISKHTIIINPMRSQYSEVLFSASRDPNGLVECCGNMITKPWVVIGKNSNEEIDRLRKSRDHDRAESIVKNGENSPYYKYDFVFKDTYTNVVWAVRDRCLIHFLFDPSDFNFLMKAIREVARRFDGKLSHADLYKIDKDSFDAATNSNLDTYVDFAISNSKNMYNELVSEADITRKRFTQIMGQAMELAKELQRKEDLLNGFDIKTFEQKEREKAVQNYNDTKAIEQVKSIFIKDGMVNIYTKSIYVKDPRSNKWHDIGAFHITLGMLSSVYDVNSTVKVFNIKYSGCGMGGHFQAPHVYGEGRICHGNMNMGMIESYKQRNLFELVYQIIIFLQSVNVSDMAGQYINTWPEVSEEVVKKGEDSEPVFYEQISEAEKAFDDMLADALPITIH